MPRGILDHRRAKPAQALLARQVDAEPHRRGAAQLVEKQAGDAALARERVASERRRGAVGMGIELERQGEQERRDLEHAALAPALRGASRSLGPAAAAPV